MYNPTAGSIKPGTLNWRVRGIRTRKAHVTQFNNGAAA